MKESCTSDGAFTSTLEARNTHVGAISTGSMLFKEYLNEESHVCFNGICKNKGCLRCKNLEKYQSVLLLQKLTY